MQKEDKGIIFSPKHGLNPTMFKCYACGGETNVMALCGKINENDDEIPKYSIHPNVFCDKCKDVMKQGGSIIVEVTEEDREHPDKYRTGRMVGIKKEAAEHIFKNRVPFAFMLEELFKQKFDVALKELKDGTEHIPS